jgi:uncharacterized hydantoinase/oxoprolinase family protein
VIPILDGKPVPRGLTDYDRLLNQELIYTGVRRTPVCAVMPWAVAAELFATTLDVYLVLGAIPEDPNDRDTADGRPATRKHARARLARMLCADADSLPGEDVVALAESVRDGQLVRLRECLTAAGSHLRELQKGVASPPPSALRQLLMAVGFFRRRAFEKELAKMVAEINAPADAAFIVSGSGEFLAQQAIGVPHRVSLNDELGPEVSACAPAYAVAVLAAETRP